MRRVHVRAVLAARDVRAIARPSRLSRRLAGAAAVVAVVVVAASCGDDRSAGDGASASAVTDEAAPDSAPDPSVASSVVALSTTTSIATSGATPSVTTNPVSPTTESASTAGADTGGTNGPVVFARDNVDGSGEAAEIGGTLELVGSCLYITSDGAAEVVRQAVVWPFGTMWDETRDVVVSASGTELAPGADVSLGGGERDPGRLSSFVTDADAVQLITQCASDNFASGSVAVVQHDF